MAVAWKVGAIVAMNGDDLYALHRSIPQSRGVAVRRVPMRPIDESRLFGSPQWEDRQEAIDAGNNRRYSRERHIKRVYGKLHLMEDTIARLTEHEHTETGYAYTPLATLIYDLRMGVERMPNRQQRAAWRACVIGEARQIREDGSTELIRIPKQTHAGAAEMLDLGNAKSVTNYVSGALTFLEVFLFGG